MKVTTFITDKLTSSIVGHKWAIINKDDDKKLLFIFSYDSALINRALVSRMI